MTNVVNLNNGTKLDLPVERIITGAMEANLQGVVVVGYDEVGGFYFASSYADGGEVMWLLQMASKKLLEAGDDA